MISNLLMATGSQAPVSTVDMVDPFVDGSGIALYKFDGDATEESGVYNGTATNVTYTDGKFGQAMEGGSGKYMTAPIIRTDYSVSAWFYLDNTSSVARVFNRNNNTGYDYGIGALFSTSSSYVTVWNSDIGNVDFTITTHPSVGWNHMYLFMDANGDGFVVLNTIKEIFNFNNPPFEKMLNYVSIGMRQLGYSGIAYSTTGTKIDQFRIFNRALSQEEVTALYNEGQ